MQDKFNESTPQRPEGDRALNAHLVTVDLPFYIEQIRKEPSWKDSDRNAITIFKSDKLRLVLLALHAGTVMTKHTAPGIIQVQVLEGQIEFATDQQVLELSQGQLVVLHERIPHQVMAKTEAVFLLSIAV